jgi:hypothetical protein
MSSQFANLLHRFDRLEDLFRTLESQLAAQQTQLDTLTQLVSGLVSPGAREPTVTTQVCPFSQPRPLDGIIAFLTRHFAGNVHDMSIVTVTASSPFPPEPLKLRNIVDLEADSMFLTGNAPPSWIELDFGSWRVRPTYYTLRSIHPEACISNHFHGPRAWDVLGSIDGREWDSLDSQPANTSLNGWRMCVSHPIVASREYRYIRVMQVGSDYWGVADALHSKDHFGLGAIELFGTLIMPGAV